MRWGILGILFGALTWGTIPKLLETAIIIGSWENWKMELVLAFVLMMGFIALIGGVVYCLIALSFLPRYFRDSNYRMR